MQLRNNISLINMDSIIGPIEPSCDCPPAATLAAASTHPVLRKRGGWRPGAGRKRVARRSSTPHRARPPHSESHPVLVTLRSAFRPLRSQFVEPTVRRAIAETGQRAPKCFRITDYTIQYNHMHIIVEASDKPALSSGIRSLVIRIARSVNALVGLRGRFWADRWFGRELTSPRQVRTALVYVLANYRKHSPYPVAPGIDPFSSGEWFDGWEFGGMRAESGSGPPGSGACRNAPPVSRPRTTLGRVGWRRYGLIRFDDAPAGTTQCRGWTGGCARAQ